MSTEELKIGHNIKKIRELRNYTQEYLAEKLGMTTQGYSLIERDQVDVNISKLGKIAEALQVEPSQILDFNDKMVFNNYGSASGIFYSEIHNYAHETIKAYEQEISLLKEDIEFLRGLVKNSPVQPGALMPDA